MAMLKERLRVKDPLFASNVIKVCFALHNILVDCNAIELEELEDEPELDQNSDNEGNDDPVTYNGRGRLNFMINHFRQ